MVQPGQQTQYAGQPTTQLPLPGFPTTPLPQQGPAQPGSPNYFSRARNYLGRNASRAGSYVRKNAKPIAVTAGIGLTALLAGLSIGSENPYFQLGTFSGAGAILGYVSHMKGQNGKSASDTLDQMIRTNTFPEEPPLRAPLEAAILGLSASMLTVPHSGSGSIAIAAGTFFGYMGGTILEKYRRQ